jgi:hypothetical protein
MYRDPIDAFAAISSDKNSVSIDDLLKHQVLIRAKLSPEDVKRYLLQEIFSAENSRLDH